MKNIRNQIIFIIFALLIWQGIFELKVFSPILFPSVTHIISELLVGFKSDGLFDALIYSISLIIKGVTIGAIIGFVLASISLLFKPLKGIVQTVIAICDPLPSIALLPIAILWFGIGEGTIMFIVINSVVWPVCRSMLEGFAAVPTIYVETGLNLGLTNFSLIKGVYLPSSLPNIISGLKIGWARAWRALIGAEMIFGVSGTEGGLGWYIYTKRYQLETASVYASLLVIMIIGIIIEYFVFGLIEKKTIKKWGMTR